MLQCQIVMKRFIQVADRPNAQPKSLRLRIVGKNCERFHDRIQPWSRLMKTKTFCMLLLALSTLGTSTRVLAQADRGAIKGEVQDSQKANISAAKITLREESTGVSAETVAGDSGQFSFLNLLHGVYTLTVSAPGFQTTTQTNVAVNVGRTIGLVVTLQPGQVTESVNVNGTAAAVDTETSDIGTVVTAQEIKDLPVTLSGDMRNPLSFVTLTPGVSGSVPGATPDYRLHISGSASFTNDVYIDGIPVSNTNLPGDIGANHPPIDAVSEFKLINNNENAQYGLASGIVSFAFKSGTNAFHGSLFEFLQNEAFNAAGAVFDALRPEANCTTGGPACKKPGLKQHEFGKIAQHCFENTSRETFDRNRRDRVHGGISFVGEV
jgi:hypothetical protein